MTEKKRFVASVDESCIVDNLDNKGLYSVVDTVECLNELHEENNELRLQLNLCSDQRNEFHRGVRENANRVGKLKKENEELKQQNADWETSFDICKHYKEAYSTEIVKIKQTIKDMMENERTELGRSVLKQLWEAIQ